MSLADRADCIVLTSRPESTGEVRTALRARGWTDRPERNPYRAMVALCELDRARRSNAAFLGLQPGVQAGLVVDDDAPIDETSSLLEAVRRYLPRVDVWRWHAGRLRRDGASGAALAAPTGRVDLRLADADAAWPIDDGPGEAGELTREEIDMLLADGPGP